MKEKMKEVLLEKIKTLLNYKCNAVNKIYQKLLEQLFEEFIERLEENYNDQSVSTIVYYNKILNQLNKNIKSIIIPAETFCYHPSGFLEFGIDLKEKINQYQEEQIEVTRELKEQILKKNYFYYMLQAVKRNELGIGFQDYKPWRELSKTLTESQATTLAKMESFYKKEYKTMYPDGTTYHYFVYTKTFDTKEIFTMNVISMVEELYGKKEILKAEILGDTEILKKFDIEYEHLSSYLQYDKFGHKVYTPTTIINEFLKRIRKEKSVYKKIEYVKKVDTFLLEIFDYKVTTILNHKEDDQVEGLKKQLRIFENNVLYNMNYELNANMEHIKLLKTIKQKLENYQKQENTKTEKQYTIISKDKKKQETVTASVQPIQIKEEYVLVEILEVRNMNNRVLVKVNLRVLKFPSLASKVYSNFYLSLKELKHLYSSSDLGVVTKESDLIRNAIATRVVNPTIMDIINQERNNFLGEFVYQEQEERAIIYKNKSIEEILAKENKKNT